MADLNRNIVGLLPEKKVIGGLASFRRYLITLAYLDFEIGLHTNIQAESKDRE